MFLTRPSLSIAAVVELVPVPVRLNVPVTRIAAPPEPLIARPSPAMSSVPSTASTRPADSEVLAVWVSVPVMRVVPALVICPPDHATVPPRTNVPVPPSVPDVIVVAPLAVTVPVALTVPPLNVDAGQRGAVVELERPGVELHARELARRAAAAALELDVLDAAVVVERRVELRPCPPRCA